ncbi:MAG: SDR family oxidoreductase [Cyclobacteriaceae bacterium]
MNKVLVAGASGALGRELVRLLHERDIAHCAQIRNPQKRHLLTDYCRDIRMADVTRKDTVRGVCEGVHTVINTIGKSVSLFTNDPNSFYDIDYYGNLNLLREAKRAGVKRFIYISILGSETSPHLNQGWAQELFSRELMASGLEYMIVKPTGLFSGLHDLLIMGYKGIVPTIGDGKAVTNPIHQHDLALTVLEHLQEGPHVLEAGGPDVHSRREVSEWVTEITKGKDVKVPAWLARKGSHLWRPVKKELYDKFRFFAYITTHDMVAPKYGSEKLRPYLQRVYDQMTS